MSTIVARFYCMARKRMKSSRRTGLFPQLVSAMLNRSDDFKQDTRGLLSTAQRFRKLLKEHRFLRDPNFSSPPATKDPPRWRGLGRFIEAERQTLYQNRFLASDIQQEYAKATMLLDQADALELTYRADVPGKSSHIGPRSS